MDGSPIEIGDRVVGLQVPGVLTVIGREGELLEVESDRGLRMRVFERSLRKLEGETPIPQDV